MEPDEPVYDCLNLQIKGYDYTLLEMCQREIHRYAEVMGIQVDEWCVVWKIHNCFLFSIYSNLHKNC